MPQTRLDTTRWSPATVARNPSLVAGSAPIPHEDGKPVPTPGQTTTARKQGNAGQIRLGRQPNKTERAYRDAFLAPLHLAHRIDLPLYEGITLQIAPGCRYTPDWVYWEWVTGVEIDPHWELVAVEVKGPHVWDDSLVKLKNAAARFPRIRFIFARKVGGNWTIQEVHPDAN